MGVEKFILALKEFFLEILGFLLPGMVFVFLLRISINNTLLNDLNIGFNKDWNPVLFIVASYVLGYLIYGLSIFRDKVYRWLNIYSINNLVDKTIKESTAFKESYDILQKKVGWTLEKNVSSVRNLAMSYVPEVDNKIYTFMFRADLSNHLGLLALIFGISGVLMYLINHCIDVSFIYNVDAIHLTFYVFLILSTFFLHKTRMRFFIIARKMIFPIFIIKYKNLTNIDK